MLNKYDELQLLVWQGLMGIIAPAWEDGAGAPPVRHSWPKGGAPDWRIDDDVVFMQLSEAEDELNRPVDDEWLERGEDFTRRQGITRVCNLKLNAYGPNCYDNLLRIRM